MSRRKFITLALAAILCFAAPPASAQIGKNVLVRAGTPEDKALVAIDSAADFARKIELLGAFMAEFGQSDMMLLACERYITTYAAEKQFDKAFEYARQGLAYDAENFTIAMTAFRAAQESSGPKQIADWGERVAAVIAAYKKKSAPEGADPAEWELKKSVALRDAAASVGYAEYTWFDAGVRSQDPAQKAETLDRFTSAFPESAYATDAATIAGDAYRQARNTPKMLEFAGKILAQDPNHAGILLQLAEHWIETKQQLDKAEEYARRVLNLFATAAKPAGLTEDQWKQQKDLQQGLAHSALGQVHIHKKRDAQAAESLRAASPLLKPYDFYYARNQYVLGFALVNLRRPAEAKPVFAEAASLNTPYKPLAQAEFNKLAGPTRPAKKRR